MAVVCPPRGNKGEAKKNHKRRRNRRFQPIRQDMVPHSTVTAVRCGTIPTTSSTVRSSSTQYIRYSLQVNSMQQYKGSTTAKWCNDLLFYEVQVQLDLASSQPTRLERSYLGNKKSHFQTLELMSIIAAAPRQLSARLSAKATTCWHERREG